MPVTNRIPSLIASITLIIACDPQNSNQTETDSSPKSPSSKQSNGDEDLPDKSSMEPESNSDATENESTSETTSGSDSTGIDTLDSTMGESTSGDSTSSTTDSTNDNETSGTSGQDSGESATDESTSDTFEDSESESSGNSASDSESDESSGEDTGPSDEIGVFVAQGHMARTTISCDGGQSWVANQSMDNTVRCFENNFDCDHHVGSATGIDFGNGWFVASYGWGTPGEIRRSRDGINWEPIVEDGRSVAKIAFGNDVFIGGNYLPIRSDEQANNWMELPDSMINDYTVRGVGFAPVSGGRFVMGASANLIYSSDEGDSWSHPKTRPEKCGASMKGLTYGNGTIVVTSPPVVCYSTDGGDNWQAEDLDASSAPIWTGSEFMAWSQKKRYSSPNGINWSTQDLSPSNINLGPVALNDNRTFVSSSGGWQVWYEKQDFYRSQDGLEWEVLDKSKFVPSHPILNIMFARIDGPSPCL